MAVDYKYGRVTLEHGTIGEDEPVVVFRAQDATLPKLLDYYVTICLKAGSPHHHIDAVLAGRDRVLAWQEANRERVRTPNSNAFMERIRRDC